MKTCTIRKNKENMMEEAVRSRVSQFKAASLELQAGCMHSLNLIKGTLCFCA